jgi:NADH-quinone oxidoreductase subunit J
MAETWVFWIFAPVALGAAISMVLMRNPVHGALMLVVNFFTIAVFYAVLEAQFLAVVQIIVYAGAIMVLFLFVIMLIGVGGPATLVQHRIRAQKPAAVLLGLALFAALAGGVAGPWLGGRSVCGAEPAVVAQAERGRPCQGLEAANADGNVEGIGGLLFTDYVWPFEVTSVLLVIAALGAMVLGRRREEPADLVDRDPALVAALAGIDGDADDEAEEGSA